MKRLILLLTLAVAACDNHPCWPNGPPADGCTAAKPFINQYHPGECYAEPQDGKQ